MKTTNVILRRLFRCLFTPLGLAAAFFSVACFSLVAFDFVWFFRLFLFFPCFVEASNKQKGVGNFCI